MQTNVILTVTNCPILGFLVQSIRSPFGLLYSCGCFGHLFRMRFHKNIRIITHLLRTLPILLFANPISTVVEFGGSWKSYSNLSGKYNSSFIVLDTVLWNWYIIHYQYTNPARNFHSAIQKVLYNIKCWEPTRKKFPGKKIRSFPVNLILFLIKTLETYNEIWYLWGQRRL